MPSWYDIYSLDESETREDEVGIRESVRQVMGLVQKERDAGIDPAKIFVGGFSQGGAIALSTVLLENDLKLGGVISLSAYIPCRHLAHKGGQMRAKNIPIFMGHGTADGVVLYRWGEQSHKYLHQLGYNVQFNTYPGLAHSFCEEQIQDIASFIQLQIQR